MRVDGWIVMKAGRPYLVAAGEYEIFDTPDEARSVAAGGEKYFRRCEIVISHPHAKRAAEKLTGAEVGR